MDFYTGKKIVVEGHPIDVLEFHQDGLHGMVHGRQLEIADITPWFSFFGGPIERQTFPIGQDVRIDELQVRFPNCDFHIEDMTQKELNEVATRERREYSNDGTPISGGKPRKGCLLFLL